jgi:hypothetical protein
MASAVGKHTPGALCVPLGVRVRRMGTIIRSVYRRTRLSIIKHVGKDFVVRM